MNAVKKDFKKDQRQFEFTLYLNDNIIVQRFFNVIGFNPRAIKSLNFKEAVDYNRNIIQHHLKNKTLDYMNENANYFTDSKNMEEAVENKEENFLLQIKLGNDVFISRIFPAHIYHPKARYAVDIRPKVRKILSDLTNVLSSERPTKTFFF